MNWSWWRRLKKAYGWHPVLITIGLFFVLIGVVYAGLWGAFPPDVQLVWPAEKAGEPLSMRDLIVATNEHRAARSAQWGQLGDMLGGILNPVLAFLSVLGLLATVLITADQLHTARLAGIEERKQARLETKRSDERAMTAQSLSALTALLEHSRTQTQNARARNFNWSEVHYRECIEIEIADLIERTLASAREKLYGDAMLPELLAERHEKRQEKDATGDLFEDL